MKILQIISHYIPAYSFGGPLQVAHYLGIELRNLGNEIRVCTTSMKDHASDLDVDLKRPTIIDGILVFYSPVSILRYWGFSPQLKKEIKKQVEWADYVIIHAHFQYANWVGSKICRKYNKKYIIYAHSTLRKKALRTNYRYFLKLIYLFSLEYLNFTKARFIVFNAEEEMEDSIFSKNGKIIYNAIDPNNFVVESDKEFEKILTNVTQNNTVFLFLGRIDIDQKATDKLVEAFYNYQKYNPDSVLVISGPSEGKDENIIRQMVKNKFMVEKVIFTGSVDQKKKKVLFSLADVFLLPSNYEGLSISLLEAMYSALPVIVSNNVGLNKTIKKREAGLVVNSNPDDISKAMLKLDDIIFRNYLGRNAKDLVLKNFIWSKVAKTLLDNLTKY